MLNEKRGAFLSNVIDGDDLETLKDNSGCNNWEYALTEAVLISDEFWNSIT